jgi:hypothetical protein
MATSTVETNANQSLLLRRDTYPFTHMFFSYILFLICNLSHAGHEVLGHIRSLSLRTFGFSMCARAHMALHMYKKHFSKQPITYAEARIRDLEHICLLQNVTCIIRIIYFICFFLRFVCRIWIREPVGIFEHELTWNKHTTKPFKKVTRACVPSEVLKHADSSHCL